MDKVNPREGWTKTRVASMHVPPLDELAGVVQDGLTEHFKSVVAEVVESPDFREAPFHLASEGLCGSPRLADVGGPPYLVPTVQRDKVYNLADIADEINLPGCTFIGAGAGSSRLGGCNCELIPNSNLASGEICTHFAKMKDGVAVLERYMSNEFGLLANLLATEGKPGRVLKVSAQGRAGDTNFVTAIRKVILATYGEDKPIALGGVFIMDKGQAKLHVMPDFSETPLTTDSEVEDWLHFYNADAPLICLCGSAVSHDPGFDLRVEHTHVFSSHGQGGHYHYDVTPVDVEYTGYFVVAEEIHRVDAPTETHQVGRD
eukprot:m.187699 g.187699  ORF g.187699 m.187699 type:complete len:317 (-) comp24800_c0_seq1:208-1158(-)